MSPSRGEFLARINSEDIEIAALHLFNNLVLIEGTVPNADFVNESEKFTVAFVSFSDEDIRLIGFTGWSVFATKFQPFRRLPNTGVLCHHLPVRQHAPIRLTEPFCYKHFHHRH